MLQVAPISQQIWDMKYRLKDADGAARRQDDRGHLAAGRPRAGRGRKPTRRCGRSAFFAALEDFKFLPAGRILAGAGTGRGG